MKLKALTMLVIASLAAFVYLNSSRYGFRFGGLKVPFDSDKMTINDSTLSFLEAVKFKDFNRAASFHHPDTLQEKDVPKLIEKKFMIKPEALDISAFEIVRVDLDSARSRGKALCSVTVKALNTDKRRDIEIIFYWMKRDEAWYMTLESSL